jgi:hypothetical protein
VEDKIEQLKVSGKILPSDVDYLDIVNTNLGGTKTDLSISQKADLKSKILSDGSILDTLTIERSNTSAQKNKDYMRVLVPLGSKLISSTGFDTGTFEKSSAEGYKTDSDLVEWDEGELVGRTFVRTESEKTEFAGWMNLEGEQTKTLILVYMLPDKASANILQNAVYSLLFQKQNGIKPYEFSASLETGNLKPHWLSSDSVVDSPMIKFKYTTGSDQYWGVLLAR